MRSMKLPGVLTCSCAHSCTCQQNGKHTCIKWLAGQWLGESENSKAHISFC